MKVRRIAVLSFAIACLLVQFSGVFAAERAPLYPGFPPVRESKAYKKFATRTYSEFSKILYLIDRYSDSQILINYEDQNYTAAFSTTVARWFLSRNYKKQTAKEWIKQWCNKSIFSNKPIFVKLPNEKFVLAREVLDGELDDLERVVRENQTQSSSLAPTVVLTVPLVTPSPSQVLVKPSTTAADDKTAQVPGVSPAPATGPLAATADATSSKV